MNKRLILTSIYRDKDGIKKNCQVEVLTDTMLPQDINISDGIWAVATQSEIELSKVCEGKSNETIKIILPLFMMELPLGCSAFEASFSLPPYYQVEEKFEEKSFIKFLDTNLSNSAELWESIVNKARKESY